MRTRLTAGIGIAAMAALLALAAAAFAASARGLSPGPRDLPQIVTARAVVARSSAHAAAPPVSPPAVPAQELHGATAEQATPSAQRSRSVAPKSSTSSDDHEIVAPAPRERDDAPETEHEGSKSSEAEEKHEPEDD